MSSILLKKKYINAKLVSIQGYKKKKYSTCILIYLFFVENDNTITDCMMKILNRTKVKFHAKFIHNELFDGSNPTLVLFERVP